MPRLTRWYITSALLSILLSSAAAFAQEQPQSLGDLARAERHRRAQKDQPPPQRVFTNQDLQRERILEPDVAEPVEAKSTVTPPPPYVSFHAEVSAVPAGPEVSLGEHARNLRQQQAARRRVLPVVNSADLERERILPRELLQPAEMAPPASGHARGPSSPVPLPAAELSLGEVARRVRAERAQRRPQRAAVAAPLVRVQQPVRNAPRVTRHAPPATPPASAHSRPQQEECVPSENAICVRRGDSLWKLARVHLGDGARWAELWQANPEISDPDLILPGQSLRTPAQMQAPPAGGPVVAALQVPCTVPVQAFSPWDPFWTAPAATSLL